MASYEQSTEVPMVSVMIHTENAEEGHDIDQGLKGTLSNIKRLVEAACIKRLVEAA